MRERNAREIEELTERLSAYVDGELSDDECRRVEARLARDEGARRVLSELRALSSVVGSLPLESGPADIKERVLRAMERRELLDAGADLDALASPEASRPGWRLFRLLASAAVVALAAGVGYFAIRSVSEPGDDILLARHEQPAPTAPRPSAKPAVDEPVMMAKGGETAMAKRGTLSEADSLAVAAKSAKKGGRATPSASLRSTGAKSRGAEADQESVFKTEQAPAALAKDKAVTHRFAAQPSEVVYPEELTAQAFEAVANQVTITVPDRAAERVVVEQVTRFFDRNRLTNARDLPPRLQLAQTQALYVKGLAGVNTADLRSRQYLVRATPEVVDELIVQVRNEVPEAAIGLPGDDWDQAQMMSLRAPEQSAKYVTTNVETLEQHPSRDIHAAREREDPSRGIHVAREVEPTSRPSMANVPVQITSEADRYDVQASAERMAGGAETQARRRRTPGQAGTGPAKEGGVLDHPSDGGQAQQMLQERREAAETGSRGPLQQLVNVVIKVSVAEASTQPSSQPVR